MKLLFARTDLASALTRLTPLVPTRTVLPVLFCVRFSLLEDGESVKIEASDCDRHGEIVLRLTEKCPPFSPLCIQLSTLLDAAKAYAGVSAELRTTDAGMALFSSGSSKVRLPVIPGEEFPNMRLEDALFTDVGGGPASTLLTALSRVGYAVCTETTKPALLGVNLALNGSGLAARATNGAKLSKEYVGEWGETQLESSTIPTNGVRALLGFFPPDARLALRSAEERLRFSDGSGNTLSLPTLSEPFPPAYEAVIPKDNPIVVRVSRTALLAGVNRVRLVSKGVEFSPAVFTLSRDGIAINAQAEAGTADEMVPADVSGGDLRIRFNSAFVVETLSSLSEETVVLEMSEAQRPILIRDDSGNGLRVLMPMRSV
jgi:DNA polymerase-3 subunit beta